MANFPLYMTTVLLWNVAWLALFVQPMEPRLFDPTGAPRICLVRNVIRVEQAPPSWLWAETSAPAR